MGARVIRVTPTISTDAYGDADHIGTEKYYKLTDVLKASSGVSRLESIAVVDKAKQKAAIDCLFFNAEPTVASVDNAAMDIADAEMAAKYIGRVSIVAADYEDLANCSDACKRSVGLLASGALSDDLWVSFQSQGTPTYTSTTDLVFVFGFVDL